MNRKDFLSSIVPLVTVATAATGTKKINAEEESSLKIPAYLKEGDVIGITCPSGYITEEEIRPAVSKLKEWGFNVTTGRTVGARDFTFGGNDDLRAEDLQQMLDDRDIDAILFARGGYGAVRIIDKLDFTTFKKQPKWLIGFSDATVFHSHVNSNFGIASIHSKMCNSFPADWSKAEPSQIETINSIRKCLAGEKMQYTTVANEKNKPGTGEGILIGGNLSILQNLAGTESDIHTKNKILFVEDTGEYLYSIDRMFRNLKRTGKLDKLNGLIIGGFKTKPDDAGEEFGRTVYDIVTEVVKEFSYPVCFDFPVGHQKNNYALKCGVKHRLEVSESSVNLIEV
ncbi:MAG: peptidase LD-carboxypeptidase [Chitinophagaceae bacterium]|nr:peptidase LD-carboxypeptidase [Chitinophagaceae bacterium]